MILRIESRIPEDLRRAIFHTADWLERQVKAEVPDAPDFDRNRREYVADIRLAIEEYLDSTGAVTAPKNDLRRSIVERFPDAFYRGFEDEGAEETEAEDESWLTGRMNQELEFVDSLFESLKEKRGAEGLDPVAEAASRAEGYAASLDGVYSEGKLRGARAKTLEFLGDDGEENCDTCRGLKGKRHKIAWILANDAIPKPGNGYFICRGFKCQHYWQDPKSGDRYTF